MYILIMEDNSMVQTASITEDDMSAANDGILTIIDTETCQSFYDDEWHEIETYVQES